MIVMSSATGKISAGTVPIKAIDGGKLAEVENSTVGIDKCPDRSAKLSFSLRTEGVCAQKKCGNESDVVLGSNNVTKASYELKKRANTESQPNLYNKKLSRLKGQDSSILRYCSEEDSEKSSIIYSEYTNKANKYLREREKASKEISRFKAEKWGVHETQVERYKDDINNLSSELAESKDRSRNLQHRERENAKNLRSLRQEVSKLTTRASTSEGLALEARAALEQSQSQCKDYLHQMKSLKEEIEELKISNSLYEKKLELKDSMYKEQLQKMSQKYEQSEAERQKATYDLSEKLSEFENSEKKNQQKQQARQKAVSEEKNKLTKTIDTLKLTLNTLEERNLELAARVLDLESLERSQHKTEQSLNSQHDQLQLKLQSLEHKCHKLNQQKEQGARELSGLRQIHEQYSDLKKKHSDTSQELIKTCEQLNRTSSQNSSLQSRIKELETMLRGVNKDKQDLASKNIEQGREISNLLQTIELKDRSINDLNENISRMSTKLEEFRTRLDSQKVAHEETNKKLSSQVVYLNKKNEYQASEMEEIRWKLKKSQEIGQMMSQKYTKLNQQILKLNEELIIESERVKSFKDAQREHNNAREQLKLQVMSLQVKEKELRNVVKEKTESEYSLKRELKSKEQQIYLLEEKDRQRELEINEQIRENQKLLREKMQHFNQVSKEHDSTNSSLNQFKMVNEQLVSDLEKLHRENRQSLETISNIKNCNIELLADIQGLKDQIRDLEQEKLIDHNKVNDLRGQLDANGEQFKSLNKEWEKYRTSTIAAVQQLIEQLTHKENQSLMKLLAFPDQALSDLQIKALKQRGEQLAQHKRQVKQLKQSNQMMVTELSRLKEFSVQREEELQSALAHEKEKLRSLSSTNMAEANELTDRIHCLSDRLHEAQSELQKLRIDCSTAKSSKEDLLIDLQRNKESQAKFEEQIKSLLERIEHLGTENNRLRHMTENELSARIDENRLLMDREKVKNQELSDKFKLVSEQIEAVQENNQHLKHQVVEMSLANQKLLKRIEVGDSRFEQLNKTRRQLEEQLKTIQQKLLISVEAEQKQRDNIAAQKMKYEDLQIKLNQANAYNQDLHAKNKQLVTQIECLNVQIYQLHTLSNQLKDKNNTGQDQYCQTIKELQQQIIALNSDFEIKNYLIHQHELNINELRVNNEQKSQLISAKKKEIIGLQEVIEQMKSQALFLHENNETATQEKEQLQNEIHKQKEMLIEMGNSVEQHHFMSEALAAKEREIERLKDQYFALEVKFDSNSRELKSMIGDLKKEVANKTIREEELKRKFKEAQRQYGSEITDLRIENLRSKEDGELEKAEMLKELESLDRENQRLKREAAAMRDKFNQGVDKTSHHYFSLIEQKEDELNFKNEQLKENEKKIKILSAELKNCLEAWEKEKTKANTQRTHNFQQLDGSRSRISSKYEKFISDVDSRGKMLAFNNIG